MVTVADHTHAPADLAALREHADAAAQLLRCLAHPDRLMLLCLLIDAEWPVHILQERSGLEQPSLSQQLAVLRAQGLVHTRREGKFIHYRLASPAATAVIQALHGLYCQPAIKFEHRTP